MLRFPTITEIERRLDMVRRTTGPEECLILSLLLSV